MVSSRWSTGAPGEHVQELPINLYVPASLTSAALASLRTRLQLPVDGCSVLRFSALGVPLILSGDLAGAYSTLGIPHLSLATPVLGVLLGDHAAWGTTSLLDDLHAQAGPICLAPASGFLPMLGGITATGGRLGLFTGLAAPLGPVTTDLAGRLWYSYPDIPGGDRLAILRQYSLEVGDVVSLVDPNRTAPALAPRLAVPSAPSKSSAKASLHATTPAAAPVAAMRAPKRRKVDGAQGAAPSSSIRSVPLPSPEVGPTLAAILLPLNRLTARIDGLETATGRLPPVV